MTNLEINDLAPDFALPADGGGTLKLSEFRGRNVVIYFYPKDMTPGCTTEAIDFTTMADQFAAANTVVIGLSKDSPARHDKFIAKHDLKVRLASDEDGTALDAFGAWKQKKLYGRTFMGIERSTFLIDKEGIVRQIWRKVRVKGHAEAVLEAAQAL